MFLKNYRKNIMLAIIQKWGNHQGLSFTPEMLKKAQLSLGDEVSITVQPGEIIIKPIAQGKKDCEQLPKKRTVGEYVGKIHISDDFDAPLPEEFWLGESDK
jgi:antitoxin component of MazEF toxin-antitoxin module